MPLDDDRRLRIHSKYQPIVLTVGWTADLYRSVTVSVEPGRVLSCIVGPRGATEAQAREAALALVQYIKD